MIFPQKGKNNAGKTVTVSSAFNDTLNNFSAKGKIMLAFT